MASSRLSVRRFQRAEDLNSRRSDSPIWATSAIGSSVGWCWTRASTAEVATSTTTATPQEVASILNENRSPSSKIHPASSSPSHRPTSAMSVAAAPDTETRPRSRNRVSRPTRKDSRSSSGWAMTHQMRMGLAGLVMVTVSMLSTGVRFSSSRCLAARAQGGRGLSAIQDAVGAGVGPGPTSEPGDGALSRPMTVPGRVLPDCEDCPLRGSWSRWRLVVAAPRLAGGDILRGRVRVLPGGGVRRRRGPESCPRARRMSPAGRHRAARLRQAMTCVHSSRASRKSRTASWAAASEWFAPQPHWTSLAAGTS